MVVLDLRSQETTLYSKQPGRGKITGMVKKDIRTHAAAAVTAGH